MPTPHLRCSTTRTATAWTRPRRATASSRPAAEKKPRSKPVAARSELIETMCTRLLSSLPAELQQEVKRTVFASTKPHEAILFGPLADHAAAMAFGVLAPSEALLALNSEVDRLRSAFTARHVLNQVALGLIAVSRHGDACDALHTCANCFDLDAHPSSLGKPRRENLAILRANAAEAHKWLREIYFSWGEAACIVGGKSAASEVYRTAVARGVWNHPLQRPVGLFDRTVVARGFWDASKLPAARALEKAYPKILAELQQLLDCSSDAAEGHAFRKYSSKTVNVGEWSDYQLFAACRRDVHASLLEPMHKHLERTHTPPRTNAPHMN
eukprot:2135556-Prymnesium_polylepis.1